MSYMPPKPTKSFRLGDDVADLVGKNDPEATPEQIAKHRAAQRKHEGALPNCMFWHVHSYSAEDFSELVTAVDIVHCFELGATMTAHFGTHDGAAIWLIKSLHMKVGLALFVSKRHPRRLRTRQPFDLDNFSVIERDVAIQTLDESDITEQCDFGGGITIYTGKRYGEPIYVMLNRGDGLCAAWYDDGSEPH